LYSSFAQVAGRESGGSTIMPQNQIVIGRGLQFSLRQVFELTTLAAITSALAAAFGPGTLVASGGIIVAWLNLRGAFVAIQCEPRQQMAIWVAWLVFLVSLALPSVHVLNPVYGLWAAWYAYAIPVEGLLRHEPLHFGLIIYLSINVANVLIVLLPLVVWIRALKIKNWLTTALCFTMPAAWCFAWQPDPLLSGYYVWCASYVLASMATRISPATFAGMVIVTGVLATIVVRWH
jgi:hypothetical protein